jgi:hypothetical protein
MPFPRWLCLAAAIAATPACFDATPPPPTDVPADRDVPSADLPPEAAAPDASPDLPVDLPIDLPAEASPDVADDADDAPPPDAEPCATTQLRCEGQCTDVASNNTHCGRCGNTCLATQTCRAGNCADEAPCPAGAQRCRDACVDTASDAANCGACGNACGADQQCSGGACAPRPMCPSGQSTCNGACVDTMIDASHCGMCGNACPAGQSCQTGACRPTTACPTGQTACGGACVDTATDLAHCGACGVPCARGQVCTGGACRMMDCPGGQLRCGATCVATDTNAANCGVCGRACAAGQTCTAGTCGGAVTCAAGQTRCGDACADTASDPTNCGMCGRACPAGQTCVMGACAAVRAACPTGETDCAPTAPTARCVNLTTNASNCGACDRACPSGLTCTAGVCVCPTGQSLCGRACVNPQTDSAHCGGCNRACAAGQSCMMGACRCATGRTLCNGACVDGQSDESHCGACGTVCAAGQTCQAGRCACPTGQMPCGTPPTCVNPMTDRAHCGACGMACAMGTACAGGRCACPTGQTTCAGACVDTATDAAHCGMCGRACPAGTACTRGACMGAPPANDTRATATVIALESPAQTLTADTTAARNDTRGACGCTSGNDVFFRFALAAPEVVYADTLAATWDTSLFFQDVTGANVTATAPNLTCNDDLAAAGLCLRTGLQSQVVARLAAGTYFLVLSGCGAGAARINFQHLPAGNGASSRITPNATVQTAMGTTAGAGTVAGTCCTGGPEASHWWVTCPDTAAQPFHATTCSATAGTNQVAYDNALLQYSALRGTAAQVCNDDTGALCTTGATLNTTIPATTGTQGGLNVLVADACAGAGAYRVDYVLANCASGARCGASCVDTSADASHCGGCNRRCPTGNVCANGACVPPPANDLPAGAVTINMTLPQSIFAVDTRAATQQTTGSCGCTAGRDVFYNFTIAGPAPEMIYADTIGSAWDTSLFVQTSAGVNVTASGLPANGVACNDDGGLAGCNLPPNGASQILLVLNPGAYRLVVSGCGSGGRTSLRFQHLPVGNGPIAFLPPGASTPSGTTAGAGRVNVGCSGGGPENTYYWYRCPSATAAATFTASTCGRATWDTTLAQYSPGRTTPDTSVCNDDACPSALPRQSSITATIPAGPGLHALYVDGFGTAAGAYTVSITRP